MQAERCPRWRVAAAFPRPAATFAADELRRMLDARRARSRASARKGVRPRYRPLEGKMLAMIFEKPSTRTRVSFDVGMRQLGGETIMLTGTEMQLGRGETIADTARVLSRYVDAIMIRILDHDDRARTGRAYATVPVINGLTKRTHPCQIMADMHDLRGASRPDQGRDGRLDRATATTCSPPGSTPRRASTSRCASRRPPNSRPRRPICSTGRDAKARALALTTDPYEAVDGADCVVTDTWVSMGDEDDAAAATTCSRPTRSTRADGAPPPRTRSSCTACPPIAARR